MKAKEKVRYLILVTAVLAVLFPTGCTRKTEMAEGIYKIEDQESPAMQDGLRPWEDAENQDGLEARNSLEAENGLEVQSGLENQNGLEDQEDLAKQDKSGTDIAVATQGCHPQYIYVHICGAIEKPGVYQMEAGNRIFQLVELAGGLRPEAAGEAVNQASVLADGMKIQIPTVEEAKQKGVVENSVQTGGEAWVKTTAQNGVETGESQQKETSLTGIVNINTATESELCALNGIGVSRAKSIVAYREAHGKFQKIEDIKKVEGIKEGAFSKIKDSITVE